jgi:phospholipase D1/2
MRCLRRITGIPYFKFLKKESHERGSDVSRADFARLQREALENYLVDLIRAVVGTFSWVIYLLS